MNSNQFILNILKLGCMTLTLGALIGHGGGSGDPESVPLPSATPERIVEKSCLDVGDNGYCLRRVEGSAVISDLSGISHIEGGIYIDGSGLEDLSGLEALTEIDGDLIVYRDDSLVSLNGLQNLQRIGGDLVIFNANNLQDISGLASLTTLGGSLLIEDNDQLVSLAGLESLSTVGGDVIFYLGQMGDLLGLSGVTHIEGSLHLEAMFIKSLDGLDALQSIGGGITLKLGALTSIDALSNLSGTLTNLVINNTPVTSLQSLQQIEAISEEISISGTTISSLDGLSQLEVFTGALTLDGESLDSMEQLSIGESLRSLRLITPVGHQQWPDLTAVDQIQGELYIHILDAATIEPAFTSLQQVGGSLIIRHGRTLGELICHSGARVSLGFDALQFVGNDLYIELHCDEDYMGFEGLQTVTGLLSLLGDMTGAPSFSALESIGGLSVRAPVSSLSGLDDVTINGANSQLTIFSTKLTELPILNLPENMWAIRVGKNSELVSFEAIQPSKMTLNNFEVSDNSKLESISGFGPILQADGEVRIIDNPRLADLQVLDGISNVTEIRINNNDTLNSLEVFRDIVSLRHLIVEGNDKLQNFGFDALAEVEGLLAVVNNEQLCQSELEQQVSDQLVFYRDVTIHNNQGECLSQ